MGSFQSLAQASNGQRLLGVYGDQQSWSMMYNLYADKLLGTNIVPSDIYDMRAYMPLPRPGVRPLTCLACRDQLVQRLQ